MYDKAVIKACYLQLNSNTLSVNKELNKFIVTGSKNLSYHIGNISIYGVTGHYYSKGQSKLEFCEPIPKHK